MDTLPQAFRPQEAARLLSIHRSTLNRMVIAGEITPITMRGHRRIPRAEIERIIGAPISERAAKPALQEVIPAVPAPVDADVLILGVKFKNALVALAKRDSARLAATIVEILAT